MAHDRPTDADAHRLGQPSAQNQGTGHGQGDLAYELTEVARELHAEDSVDAVLDEVVGSAVALIPGSDEGSISLVLARREVVSQSPSGELARLVDAVQVEVGEGPCLDAVYEEQTVRVADMRRERRWPRFASRAAQLGVLSMLSFRLHVEGENLSALNVYARAVNAFDDASEHVGLLFASHAAMAYGDAEKLGQLQEAVANRDVIGQAKGILMERFEISSDQAFRVLVRVSQNSNRKLRDMAEEVATTRRLDKDWRG